MSDTAKDAQKHDRDSQLNKINAIERFQGIFRNDYHTFVVRKSEKLASALYVITGFIPHDEPIRGRLRVCALDLISKSSDSNHFSGAGPEQFASRCAEIGTILETAVNAGLVSPMNARLMCDEYADLAGFVREHRSRISEAGGVHNVSVEQPGGLKDKIGNGFIKTLSVPRPSHSYVVSGKVRQKDRRSRILALFKNKDRLGIRDVVGHVNGCSEKTIQRELLALVRDGLLAKEGDRRWSVYRKIVLNQPLEQPS
jgi:hypothetical protein